MHSNRKWNSSSTALHILQSRSCGGVIGRSQRPVSTRSLWLLQISLLSEILCFLTVTVVRRSLNMRFGIISLYKRALEESYNLPHHCWEYTSCRTRTSRKLHLNAARKPSGSVAPWLTHMSPYHIVHNKSRTFEAQFKTLALFKLDNVPLYTILTICDSLPLTILNQYFLIRICLMILAHDLRCHIQSHFVSPVWLQEPIYRNLGEHAQYQGRCGTQATHSPSHRY